MTYWLIKGQGKKYTY